MAVSKNRTNLFLSYRKTYPRNVKNDFEDNFDLDLEVGNESIESLAINSNDRSQNIDLIIKNIILPIEKNLEHIDTLLRQLDQQYKTAILPSFNDDQQADFKKVEKTSFEIMKLIQGNFKYIKFVQEQIQNDKATKQNEFTIILTNMNTLYASKIQSRSNEYKVLQNKYLKFLNKDDFKPLPSLNNKANDFSNTDILLLDEEDEQMKQLMIQKQVHSQKKDRFLAERDQEIVELSQNVLEINTIFKDLQTMIIDQSSIVNSIESNIYEFQNDVVEAKREIDISERYNKRENKCKITLFLVLLCLFVLMLLLTKK
ncbi:Tlg2 protein [Hanseniaspora uvarum]|nr:Tlg2 protein [Hanseniaspora uvarum]